MRETAISVTEAARNFADCVNRARYQDMTFVLLKNGLPVARLSPADNAKKGTGRELAAALENVRLTDEELRSWTEDLEAARSALATPVNAWE